MRAIAGILAAVLVLGLCGNGVAGTNPGPSGRTIGGDSTGLTDCPTCREWDGARWISDGYIEVWIDTNDDGIVDSLSQLIRCPRCNGSGRITAPSARRVIPTYERPYYGR